MNIQELLESMTDHDLVNHLITMKNKMTYLHDTFNAMVQRHGYETARKILIDQIPDPTPIKWYVDMLSNSNGKVKLTYDSVIEQRKILYKKIDSGL